MTGAMPPLQHMPSLCVQETLYVSVMPRG